MGKPELEAIIEKDGAALIKQLVSRAKSGDSAALRMCIDRLLPLQERAINLVGLPRVASMADLPKAVGFIVEAMASGGVKPSEGNALITALGGLRTAFEAGELIERIRIIEERLGGPFIGRGEATGLGLTQ
jgi:hypothetical protein